MMGRWTRSGVLLACLCVSACGGGDKKETPVVNTDALGLDVVIEAESGTGLVMAAEDLVGAWAEITGGSPSGEHIVGSLEAVDAAEVVEVRVDASAAIGAQGYAIESVVFVPGRTGLRVTASTEIGAMYGLYDVLGRLGARYIHPEETFLPENPALALPTDYTGAVVAPHFEKRGFHEHTQHPIVMSDFMLRPEARFRPFVSRYLQWMARNRQNVLSFHFLKTVDLEAWTPYMQDITAEAERYGIRVGAVIGFVDEQQNAYKMIRGEDEPEDAQIKRRLDAVLAGGLHQITFQIGASEFTKPADADVLRWLDIAVTHIEANHPDLDVYAWIHITCSLESEDGGYFFHLPLQASSRLGAYVHTTMFYTLDDPAPVYDCETFEHQIDFMTQADDTREQVFFPETAWWLGFDNNAPVVMPITGVSRERDIRNTLPNHAVTGHVTFTTGREWTYWQYDHYLTRITWDGQTTWAEYLDWLGPVYGGQAETVTATLKAWTDLQVRHFYDETPEIYFYIAGELDQDELGEQAGILARRPKPSFQSILDLDAAGFAAWQEGDLSTLKSMRSEYTALVDTLPEKLEDGSALQTTLFGELRAALAVYARRIDHTVVLYTGVEAMRPWVDEVRAAAGAQPPREPDTSIRDAARNAAMGHLIDARAITEEMLAVFEAQEATYRYPLDLLVESKPDSLTAYPFGYLEQTSSGHFWTRRDAQLERLIERTFAPLNEAWTALPDALFITNSGLVDLVVPDDPIAGSVIPSFVPQLLFGLAVDDALPLGEGGLFLQLAQDYNRNLLPDEGTEQGFEGAFDGEPLVWRGTGADYPIVIRDSAGDTIGTLDLIGPNIALALEANGEGGLGNLVQGDVEGDVSSEGLIDLVGNVGGIDRESTANLIKTLYDIEAQNDLPQTLPIHFRFTYVTPGD